ncbi:MAG: reverse transcriptase domain-containing protein, partial [Chromatiales bacterium]
EYNIPLCIAFVDYEKAFDSVQTQTVLTTLQEQGIEDVYVQLLKDIYTNSSMTVNLHKEINKIRRGVPQGDTISPKLTWETRGLRIDGEYLSHLRLADDIFICANTPHELQQMLQELADESENQGLKVNNSKTKVMME